MAPMLYYRPSRWRQRYIESGLAGIERDLPRGAPPVKLDAAKLVELTTQTQPEAATHWMEHAQDGRSAQGQSQHRHAALAGQRAEATLGAGLQDLARSEVR